MPMLLLPEFPNPRLLMWPWVRVLEPVLNMPTLP
ncbi:Uncharacterised protein [Mycobacterium tuberculosis]|nr:Uncharacterised protein [Mycobacterium tuberculosis]